MVGIYRGPALGAFQVGYAASSFFSNTLNAALMDLAAGNKDDVVAYKQRDAGAKGWGVVFGPWLAGAVVKYRSGADFFVSGDAGCICWGLANIRVAAVGFE